MNYNKEFNIDPKQVENEVRRIKIEKREYDDYGKPVYNQTLTRKDVVV
jgi:hypothetical protein